MGKMFREIKENFTRKNLIQLIVLTVLIIIGCSVVYSNEIVPRAEDAYTDDPVEADEDNSMLRLTEGDKVTQVFTFENDQMIGISMELYSDTSKNKGELYLAVFDNATEELIGEATLDAADIDNMTTNLATDEDVAYITVNMPTIISGNAGREMRAELTVRELKAKSRVYLLANASGEENYESIQVEGTKTPVQMLKNASEDVEDEDISAAVRTYSYHYNYWNLFFKVGVVLVCILLYGCYFMIFLLKKKPEKTFLLAGAVMAIFVSFLLPPLTVPDEMVHMTTSYYYSNAILGIEEPSDETIYVRETDREAFERLQTTPDLKEYDYFMWNLGRHPKSTELVEYGGTQESKNWALYIPTIVGVTLGRLIGLNGITTIYLGRFFAVLVYLAVFYFAIKKMPKGKAAMFIFAICPMVLQQCCSFSYDALPIELSALFLAELFNLLYTDRQVNRKDAVLLAILMFFLSSSKGGVYIPECLLVLLIPKEKYETAKIRKVYKTIFAAAVVLGFVINTVPYLALVFGMSDTVTKTQEYSNSLGCYTVSEVLSQPVHTGYVLINTILMYVDYYFQGMFMQPLGWLNIAINPFFAYLMAAFMFLGVTCTKNEMPGITKRQKWCMGLAVLATVAMTTASMMVSWTTSGNLTVTGLQGRYFTPVFLYLLFLLRTKFIKIENNIDMLLIFGGITIDVFVLNNILSSVQSVM